MREKGRLWRVSLNAPSCWQRVDVPIPFNEQISGLTPKSNEKQCVRECKISSDLLLLLQIKPLHRESRWYLRCSDPDARDDLWLNPLLLFWRCAGFTGGLNACCFISLTQFYHFCQNCISLSPYSSSCDAILCPSISFLEILRFTLFCVPPVAEYDMLSNHPFLFGRITWNASFLWHVFLFKTPGWPVPSLPCFDLLSVA